LLAGRALERENGAEGLVDWSQTVQARHKQLAGDLGFEDLRAEAERQARGGALGPVLGSGEDESGRIAGPSRERRSGGTIPLPERGTPFSWEGGRAGEVPRLRLVAAQRDQTQLAAAATGTWLGLIGVAWLATLGPFLLARLRSCWPEQLAALGLIGWHVAGPQLVVLILLGIGVLGRLIRVVRGLGPLLRRRPVVASSGGSGS
jgi:hypothetical protein